MSTLTKNRLVIGIAIHPLKVYTVIRVVFSYVWEMSNADTWESQNHYLSHLRPK